MWWARMGVSIVIPIKRPEPYYPQLRRKLCQVFGSEDFEVLEQYERGLVNAIVHGAKKAKHNLVAVLDADGSHRPVDLYSMYHCALNDGCDLVIGSKVLGVDCNPFYRRSASMLYRLLARIILGYKVSDTMSGIVVCKRELMLKVKPTSEYKFILQLLMYAQKIKEVPIVFMQRRQGKSKVNPILSIYTFYNLFKLRRKWVTLKKEMHACMRRRTRVTIMSNIHGKEKPFKTEDCEGCICVDWTLAANNRGFCSGFVKEPKPKEDVLRFCFLDKDHATAIDLEVDEALTIASILASCSSDYIKKRLKR